MRRAEALDLVRITPKAVIGWVRYSWGDFAGAIAQLDATEQLEQRSTFTYFWRARALEMSGRTDEALADARRAVELSNPNRGPRISAARPERDPDPRQRRPVSIAFTVCRDTSSRWTTVAKGTVVWHAGPEGIRLMAGHTDAESRGRRGVTRAQPRSFKRVLHRSARLNTSVVVGQRSAHSAAPSTRTQSSHSPPTEMSAHLALEPCLVMVHNVPTSCPAVSFVTRVVCLSMVGRSVQVGAGNDADRRQRHCRACRLRSRGIPTRMLRSIRACRDGAITTRQNRRNDRRAVRDRKGFRGCGWCFRNAATAAFTPTLIARSRSSSR